MVLMNQLSHEITEDRLTQLNNFLEDNGHRVSSYTSNTFHT